MVRTSCLLAQVLYKIKFFLKMKYLNFFFSLSPLLFSLLCFRHRFYGSQAPSLLWSHRSCPLGSPIKGIAGMVTHSTAEVQGPGTALNSALEACHWTDQGKTAGLPPYGWDPSDTLSPAPHPSHPCWGFISSVSQAHTLFV